MSRTAPILVVLLALASCASHESFSVSVMRPAPVDLGAYDLIAIDRFQGEGCDPFANDFAASLRASTNPVTGQKSFEIVDRRDVDRLLDDMRRYPNSNLGKDPNSPLAKWKRAPVVLAGQMTTHDVEDLVECIERPRQDEPPQKVFVRNVIARVCVTIEAKESGDGRLVDSVRVHGSARARREQIEGEPQPVDHQQLLAAARRDAMGHYLKRIVPHYRAERVQLYTDGDLPSLQIGNGFARTGDWEEALRSYQTATESATGDKAELRYKAVYNRGVALLYLNRFADARDALKAAYAQSQDASILQTLQTIPQRERDFQVLQSQGRRATPDK